MEDLDNQRTQPQSPAPVPYPNEQMGVLEAALSLFESPPGEPTGNDKQPKRSKPQRRWQEAGRQLQPEEWGEHPPLPKEESSAPPRTPASRHSQE